MPLEPLFPATFVFIPPKGRTPGDLVPYLGVGDFRYGLKIKERGIMVSYVPPGYTLLLLGERANLGPLILCPIA